MTKIKLIIAMFIFGTLGIFVSMIDLPSSFISMSRAVIGTLFLGIVMLISKRKFSKDAIKKNAVYLLISGLALGFNWILLFEAYRYTTVAVATLCYYMAPVFMILLSPFVLKEKLTLTKGLCSLVAVIGAVLISGAAIGTGTGAKGVFFGLCAAVLYCGIVLTNKFIKGLPDIEITFLQLAISAVIMIPYVFITEDVSSLNFNKKTILIILLIGIVHTGIAYMLYFSSIQKVPAQTAAIFSYIDPVTAVLLSALILKQDMTTFQIVGTILIFTAAIFNEVLPSLKNKSSKQRS